MEYELASWAAAGFFSGGTNNFLILIMNIPCLICQFNCFPDVIDKLIPLIHYKLILKTSEDIIIPKFQFMLPG